MSMPMALEPTAEGAIRRGDKLLASSCVTVARWLLRLPLGSTVRLVKWLTNHTGRPATVTEAEELMQSVLISSRGRRTRIACLERSLAVVLLAGVKGRSVDWCIGARFMPFASHAWIETGNVAICEPDRAGNPYRVLLRIRAYPTSKG